MTDHSEHFSHDDDDREMKMTPISELRAGDVLLCYNDNKVRLHYPDIVGRGGC